MFRACLMSGLIVTLSAADHPEKLPAYQLPTPTGWRKESFALPPTFAPDMKWKGKEELRFAPDMFKANARDFFCYAFLFWLSDDAQIDAKTLEWELLAYYRGLASAVSKSKKRQVDTKAFSLTITPDNEPNRRAGGEAVAGYLGELKWTEPFATAKPQTLRLEIHSWTSASNHRCVFLCVSPQPPTAAVWKTLREIRAGCTCR